MIENGENIFSIEGIRVMAREILSCSGDLLEIDLETINEKLLPRIDEYQVESKESNYLPEGSNLPLMEEVGLNLFVNAVNFCFKDPETGCEYVYTAGNGEKIKRATGLQTAMSRSGINWNDVLRVADIGDEEWKNMLQLGKNNILYLGSERRNRVTSLAKYLLLNRGYFDIDNFLYDCRRSIPVIISRLGESGQFEDVFMKRSQLTCRMINEVLVRRGEIPLSGIEKLTVMADYRIPQVLYNTGVVNIVNRSLSIRLQNEIPLHSGSREELALRASAVSVGEYLANTLGITEAEVDGALWGLSQKMAKNNEFVTPHMMVATDAY